MNLAARWANRNQWSAIRYESVPFGAAGFDFSETFGRPAPGERGWFLTKRLRRSTKLASDAFMDMETMETLIQDVASPLFGLFEPVASLPIHQPLVAETSLLAGGGDGWLDDSVTLWRQTRRPTADETRAAIAFVEPRYVGKAGHDRMVQQRVSLGEDLTPGGDPQTPDSPVWVIANGARVRDVRFAGVGLTRFRGHLTKGGYDAKYGREEELEAVSEAVS